MRVNRNMKALLERHPAVKADVPREFQRLVEEGFKKVEGCVSFRNFSIVGFDPASALATFGDETGYEATLNGLHLEDYLDPGTTLEPLAWAHVGWESARWLAQALRARGDGIYRVLLSARDDDAVLRFHRLRPGITWLAGDLDGYEEESMLELDTTDLEVDEGRPWERPDRG